jgi:hypothetical protein
MSENEIMIQFIQSLLFDMSGGNPGAITVLREILTDYPDDFFYIIEKMKKHNIVDYHIWVLYKKKNQEIHSFVKHIQELE